MEFIYDGECFMRQCQLSTEGYFSICTGRVFKGIRAIFSSLFIFILSLDRNQNFCALFPSLGFDLPLSLCPIPLKTHSKEDLDHRMIWTWKMQLAFTRIKSSFKLDLLISRFCMNWGLWYWCLESLESNSDHVRWVL